MGLQELGEELGQWGWAGTRQQPRLVCPPGWQGRSQQPLVQVVLSPKQLVLNLPTAHAVAISGLHALLLVTGVSFPLPFRQAFAAQLTQSDSLLAQIFTSMTAV